MTESDLVVEPNEPEAPQETALVKRVSPAAVMLFLFQIVTASMSVTSIVWLIGLWLRDFTRFDVWTIMLIAISSALLTSCWGGLVRRRYWAQPTQRLLDSIQQVREGELTIEELSQIGGGIQPMVEAVQELLRVQRQQKVELLELEQEVRDRIANRTDALERKIGSLKHQAMRDVLTGLMNRRAMDQEIPRLLEKHISKGQDSCLLIIDVDNFKALNDTLGHVAGDQLLKEIGQIIRSTIRDCDMAFRCGGDEFVILLIDAGPRLGIETSRRLESLVEVLTQPLHLTRPPRLSIGVCALSELEHPSGPAWLEIADKRLYSIKSDRKTRRSEAAPSDRRKSA